MDQKSAISAAWQQFRDSARDRLRWLMPALMAAFVVGLSLEVFGFGESIENSVTRPIMFSIRELFGKSPKLDPRLVMYAYGDDAVRKWGRPELLSGKQWGELIGAIADHKPRAILVDMVFGNVRKDPSDVAAMNRAFRQGVPVYTGAVVMPKPIDNALPLKPKDKAFAVGPSELSFLKKNHSFDKSQTPYGPAPNLTQLMTHIGHINFRAPGFVKPLVGFPPDKMLKHIALAHFDAADLKINGAELFFKDKKISINASGEAIINWSPKKEYFSNTYRILDLVAARRSGQKSNLINSESIVLFLPLMFTGNADFKTTFIGQLPGGYAQAAIINSALTGRWVTNYSPGFPGMVVALGLGVFAALLRRVSFMVVFFLVVNLSIFFSSVWLFLNSGLLISQTAVFLCFNLVLVPVIALVAISNELRSIKMSGALAGVLPPRMLEQLNKDPGGFTLSPVEQVVTVMFVDFVGFSKVSERFSSQQIFDHLKSSFSALGKIIQNHDGIVDKSLGDGMLGVFGFDPVTRAVSNSHAMNAVKAAVEIQQYMAKSCAEFAVSDQSADKLIFSSRIGLNTGPVFIGDLGDGGRLDLTVIGNAVNLGKRYEAACEPFKVLMGGATKKYLAGPIKSKLVKRSIQIKHQAEAIDAYELDPLSTDQDLLHRATEGFQMFTGAEPEKL